MPTTLTEKDHEAVTKLFELLKAFRTEPDGMHFMIDRQGNAIPLGYEIAGSPDVEMKVAADATEPVDETYAIVRFIGNLQGTGPRAEAFRAKSVFEARAKAEAAAVEDGHSVSIAIAVGTLKVQDDERILFRSLEFIDFVRDETKQAPPSTTTIQTLIFSKDTFSNAGEAKSWAQENGFKAGGVDETDTSFRIRQKDPGAFQEGSFRTITLTEGVKAVIGRPKAGEGKAGTEAEIKVALEKDPEPVAKPAHGPPGDPHGRRRRKDDPQALVTLKLDTSGIEELLAKFKKEIQAHFPANGSSTGPEGEAKDMRVSKYVKFVKKDEERRIVFGEVYVPDEVDAHGDFMRAETIRKMAYDFMMKYRNDPAVGIDRQHDSVPRDILIVESFVARAGDPDFTEGSWVMAAKVLDDAIWKQVLDGTLTGFSFAGLARARELSMA